LVQQRRVTVVVDSSSCLPQDLQQASGIIVVPHQLITNDLVYRDGVDIQPGEFYQLQQNNGSRTTTSAPAPQAFLDAFQQAGEGGNDVLCLTVSPRFSAATLDSARIAMRMAQEQDSGQQISVMDSQAAAGAEGFIALEAARAATRGATLQELVESTQRLIPRVHLLAFLDTLHYLGRSGKITKVKAWAGSLLGLKPLTELSHGEARLISKPRSRAKAMVQLLGVAQERMGQSPAHVNVMHANAPDDAAELRQKVESTLNCREIFVSEFTPVMGAHTGPGVLGLAFYADA